MTKGGMHVFLRGGEKLYVNGAVLRVDRKVSVEFMNDVTFLLESHVLQAEQATSPLRQLYYVLQTMLIEPAAVARTRKMFEQSYAKLLTSFSNKQILVGLQTLHGLVKDDRVFEALKALRALFPVEDAILSQQAAAGCATKDT
jgi:flagellar biosynthesis repressor protein FlbT